MASIAATVLEGAHSLRACSDSPRLDAELLLGKILGLSRTALLARHELPIADGVLEKYQALLVRRAAGAPVAYLLGNREFWSLNMTVTPAVLVPRPETELLVERALASLPAEARASVLDLGTGSGAIALAIAMERPHWRITAVELSPQALEVAMHNARLHNCAHIEWRLGTWFDPLARCRFDMIVSNPPYIAALDPALLKLSAEPALALTPGPTGLEALDHIIGGAVDHLLPAGMLLLEHGASQAPRVAALMQRRGLCNVQTFHDFSGRPRVTQGVLHSPQGSS